MIKFGVCSVEELKRIQSFKGFWGGERKISISLYNKLDNFLNKSKIQERILRFSTDDRGAYKRTYNNRFDEFDEKIIFYIDKYFGSSINLAVKDLAVSDGRTSLALFRKLKKNYPALIMEASDYNNIIYVIRDGSLTVSVTPQNSVVEIMLPPFIFCANKKEHIFYLVNHVVYWMLKNRVNKCIKKYLSYQKKDLEKIFLISDDALSLCRETEQFVIKVHNILDSFTEKTSVHLVRAMNILNFDYFNNEEVCQILNNIHNVLVDGGIFALGSNSYAGTEVDGSIYRKFKSGFEIVYMSGKGTSFNNVIENFFVK